MNMSQFSNVLLDVPSIPKIIKIKALQVLPKLPDVDTLIEESRRVQLTFW